MKFSFMLLIILIEAYLSVVPNWDYTTSVTNLLSSDSITYIIDERKYWYEADDKLEKTIKKENGVITLTNTLTLTKDKEHSYTQLFKGEVPFESIESFYSYVDEETSKPIICPRGAYNPFEVQSGTQLKEISQYNTEWIKNAKYDLKCYYHRHEPFLIFYLMNKESYVLRLKNSQLSFYSKFKFGDDIEEIFDFKLQNRERRTGKGESWIENPYPFMALVKRNNYLELIGTQYDFNAEQQQNIQRSRQLIPIKTYTQAYFNNFHFNNSFYYFTYNDIHDFVSGYSTTSISNVNKPAYDQINSVVWVNNEVSPFEFQDEVEIIKMENIFNYRYVY